MFRFSYIIPGIGDALEDARDWDYQAQRWLYDNHHGLSAGFNYHADVIGGVTSRPKFAAMIASDLRQACQASTAYGASAGRRVRVFEPVVAAGHSNGCNLLAMALLDFPGLFLDRAVFVAPPLKPDCEANGLNTIARNGQAKEIVLCVSGRDGVLGLGKLLPGDGYDTLGRDGPANICPELARVLTVVEEQCGHNDWVLTGFEKTMLVIVGGGQSKEYA